MSLKDRLLEDYKSAVKAKDRVAKETISFARASIKQREIDEKRELADSDIMEILTKQIKMRKDAQSSFTQGGRDDLYEAYNQEIQVLQRYLPRQLSAHEIREVVAQVATEEGIAKGKQNMGALMKASMAKLKNIADGSQVREAVTHYLDSKEA